VAAFLLLVPLRMADEGLSAMDAVDAVLAHNLHGLEIDPRCVEIAVFALALAAWRYPDEDGNPLGVRPDMPAPRIACCGLKVASSANDWQALVPANHPEARALRDGLRQLHDGFAQAPLLGSLLEPRNASGGDLLSVDFKALHTLLAEALSRETPLQVSVANSIDASSSDTWDTAWAAQGLCAAAELLDGQYHLVATNVPYLGQIWQQEWLRNWCTQFYPEAKSDLSYVFLLRIFRFVRNGAHCAVLRPTLISTSHPTLCEV